LRNPPGARLYKWESGSAPLPVRMITGPRAKRLREESQGLYRDGWVGPKLHYMVPPGAGAITVRGLCPVAQKLAITCNGRTGAIRELAPGFFEINVEEPGLADLEIDASNWAPPASNEPDSSRRLAWVFRGIERQ